MHGTQTFKTRNPLLVLAWTFGLFVFSQLYLYVGFLLSSWFSGASFEAIISGEYADHNCVLGRGISALVLGVPLVYIAAKYLWRRDFNWMRLRFDPRLLLGGLGIGVILPFVALATVWLFGDVSVTGGPSRFGTSALYSILTGALAYSLFVGLVEETVFRGMVVREWAVKWGWSVAAVLGGLYFGLLHVPAVLGDASITNILWVLAAAIAVTGMFVALYVRSGSLWLPIGVHAAWNFSLDTLIGATMSGQDSEFGLYQTELSGPDFVTGGEFGLEASIGAIVVYVAVALVALFWSRKGKPKLLESQPPTL